MPNILDYAALHTILDFFGKNDNFNEQFAKKDISQEKKMPQFDLSIPPIKST